MERFRVLIVDDEADFVETIVKRLNAKGLDAEGVTGGREAVALLDGKSFDVCVLDVKMPGLDGLETLAEMKKKRPGMEVIILTGHGSGEAGVRGLQLGAYDFVMKPVPFADLLGMIVRAYERKLVEEERARPARTR
ncbi:MAG: response regulator [Candidatus Riflebacteria bacterium]|nr:response regulator [Candidatus Riflebacteria bacterium]